MRSITEPYLVQRLTKPLGHSLANAFAFGGGLKNGGLSNDAMSLLSPIFGFDYMGSAEFEWGAVPDALSKLAKTELEASTFTLDHADVDVPKWSSFKRAPGSTEVGIIYPKGKRAEVEQAFRNVAGRNTRLKEDGQVDWALFNSDDYSKVIGWLELNTGWFAFIDLDAFNSTMKLFGIKVDTPA